MKKTVLAVLAACSFLGGGTASASILEGAAQSMWSVVPNSGSFSVAGTPQWFVALNTDTNSDASVTFKLLSTTNPNGGLRTVQAEVWQNISVDPSPFWYKYDDTSSVIASAVLSQGGPGLSFIADHTKNYVMRIFGFNNPTGSGSFSGSVSAVPLPAAVWLFGSALLGFLGLSNRRKL